MPEEGVTFNQEALPPQEYLMRRSYNRHDAEIPGSVVREKRCARCGQLHRMMKCPVCRAALFEVYSVDVPLVKENGERWR